MIYSAFISKLRLELKDLARLARDRWDGDASTTLFETSKRPIKDASYTVKIGGTAKTEVTDYSIDKDTGIIEFTSAPVAGSDNVEISYRSLNLRDGDYLEIINDAIDRFQWTFWKEGLDESTFTTVKDQYEYDLSSLTSNILYVLGVWYKASSNATTWSEVRTYGNWAYYPRRKKLIVNPPFDTSSLPMKIRYLYSLTKGDTTSATLDIPTEWLTPYKYLCYARFYERQVPEKISEVGAITTVPGFLPGPNIINVAEYFYKKADETAKKIAPKLPPLPIPSINEGVVL